MSATRKKKMASWQVFLMVVIVLTVVSALGYAVVNNLLNAKPFDKGTASGGEDNIVLPDVPGSSGGKYDVLVPAEGIFAAEFQDAPRVNVLLIGKTREGLSDTIMLASFDTERKHVDLISVPRDTYYPRSGYSGAWLKMNAVFHDGAPALAQGVHSVLQGIPVNYYAVFDYDGVAKIVDAIGGVPMNIQKDMNYIVPAENLYIDIKAGQQVLDGNHAVQYLRFRSGYVNGDIGRVEAQQQFMKNALAQLLKSNNIAGVGQLAIENIDSDMRVKTVIDLAGMTKDMDGGNINSYILPGTSGGIDGLSFWKPTGAVATETMLREIYGVAAASTPAAVQ